jgi:segregation and condensation protein A
MATITFDRAARPDQAARVQLDGFDGPMALLLNLIEQRQLDILTVRLGELCGAYLEALAALPGAQLPHASAFISVSAQLILIKSRAMLPRPQLPEGAADDAPDPEAALRERLLLYRRYRDAAALLAARLDAGVATFRREASVALAAARAGAREPQGPPLDPERLRDALAAAFRLAPVPEPPPEVMLRTITIEERAAVIRGALRRAPLVVLQDLLAGVRDRVVVAITFLAMLELVKEREVRVEQSEPWGPIVCRRVTRTPVAVSTDVVEAAGPGQGLP